MDPNDILTDVCRRSGITREQLREERCKLVRDARRECAVRLRGANLSYASIGLLLGLEHSSVIYLIKGPKKAQRSQA